MAAGASAKVPAVRSQRLVAGAAVTAALALIALPGPAGSGTSWPMRPVEAASLRQLAAGASRPAGEMAQLDPDHRSAGHVAPDAAWVEPGVSTDPVSGRPPVVQPRSPVGSVAQAPRRTITGFASFYDNGTTAMRLPRGTLVVICGAGGCIERRVTDYGPSARIHPERVVDLYRPDFFAICGCPSWSGTTRVTVHIY